MLLLLRTTMTRAAESPTAKASAEAGTKNPTVELPPDLGTRKTSKDRPASRPHRRQQIDRAGHSHQIVAEVSADRLATSARHWLRYAHRSAAAGCFSFRDLAGKRLVEWLKSETGEPLWQFEYQTDYEDLYGYDNGPRGFAGRRPRPGVHLRRRRNAALPLSC